MSYATYDEFKIKYDPKSLGLSLDDTGGEEAVKKSIAQFLDDASNFIDTYLFGKYSVPISPVPNSLRRANMIIAKYDIEHRRPGSASDEENTEYDNIIKWLEAIASGELDLPGVSLKTTYSGIIESNSPVFDPDNFDYY